MACECWRQTAPRPTSELGERHLLAEQERPKVDWAELTFLKSEALHPADFTNRAMGWQGSIRSWRRGWRVWESPEKLSHNASRAASKQA